MAGFHLPGDPYYPNQGNGGWIEEDPEEDPEEVEEELEVKVGEEFEVDEEVEEITSGTDSEPEVIDPPIPHPPESDHISRDPFPCGEATSTTGAASKVYALPSACAGIFTMSVGEAQLIEHFLLL